MTRVTANCVGEGQGWVQVRLSVRVGAGGGREGGRTSSLHGEEGRYSFAGNMKDITP